jgi:uncharacterized protein (DUF4213/DUF364 family)
MRILDALLQTLDAAAPVRDIRLGLFHTGVLTRGCGLASTLPRDALKQRPLFQPLVTDPGRLLEKSARELARLSYSENLPEASIGMATVNSLLEIDEHRCLELNAGDLIAEKGEGKRIAIVGHFPFIPKLREIAKDLWVIEKNPQKGDRPESDGATLIPRADVVGITGATFTNHSIEPLLECCSPTAYVVVLGDSAPLSPLLFDFGVNAVSGTLVTDPELALRCISQGATFRQIKGRRLLTMVK